MTAAAAGPPAPHPCPCACGQDIDYRRFCCRPGWDRLPGSLRREISSTRASVAARTRAMDEARAWFAAHPRGGSRAG